MGFELGPFDCVGDSVGPLTASVGLDDEVGDADGTSLGQDKSVRATENSESCVLVEPVCNIVPSPDSITSFDGFKKKFSGTFVSMTRIRRPDPRIVVSPSIDSSIEIIT